MHELGMAEGILNVVLEISGDQRVQRVVVRAGAMQAIDPDSLAFSFQLLADETRAAGAALQVSPAEGDVLLVDEVECAGDPPVVIRRPNLEVVEAPHEHDADAAAHNHPAWR